MIAGDGEPPDISTLVAEIHETRAGAEVTVRIVPETVLRSAPDDG